MAIPPSIWDALKSITIPDDVEVRVSNGTHIGVPDVTKVRFSIYADNDSHHSEMAFTRRFNLQSDDIAHHLKYMLWKLLNEHNIPYSLR